MVERPVVFPWESETCLGVSQSFWLLCRHSMHWQQRFAAMRSTSTRWSMLSLIRLTQLKNICIYPGEIGIKNTRKAMSDRFWLLDHAEYFPPDLADPRGPGIFGGSDSGADPGVAVWGFGSRRGPHYPQNLLCLHTKTKDIPQH